jgi:RNA polymerase sigma factor (sigma-70 family)
MSAQGSITSCVRHLGDGQTAATQSLWERYYARLGELTLTHLKGLPRPAHEDAEDVALSAFFSFSQGIQQGRFPQLADRHGLWLLLVKITLRKAIDLYHRETRGKRDVRRVQGGEDVWDQLAAHEPSPALAAQLADEVESLLPKLDEPELRLIALRKMEGYSNAEIAKELNRSEITVERRLRRIRSILKKS